MKFLNKLLFAAILITVLSGCGRKNYDENSHPLFKRAVQAQEANEIGLAIGYFHRFLVLKPESSKTHLILASIYDENLDKPLKAVYHYERFLEFDPKSPEAANVKKWLEAARRKFYYRTRIKYNDPEDVGILQNSLYLKDQELKKCREELKKAKSLEKKLILYARQVRDDRDNLKSEFDKLKISNKKLLAKTGEQENDKKDDKPLEGNKSNKDEEPKLQEEAEVKTESKDAKKPEAIPETTLEAPEFELKEPKKSIEKKERTYTVQKGDSLSSIARELYGSARYYKLIFDANRETLPTEKALRPGQILKIPAF